MPRPGMAVTITAAVLALMALCPRAHGKLTGCDLSGDSFGSLVPDQNCNADHTSPDTNALTMAAGMDGEFSMSCNNHHLFGAKGDGPNQEACWAAVSTLQSRGVYCCATVKISDIDTNMQQATMGHYLRLDGVVGQAGHSVYRQREAPNYLLYFWSEFSAWRIGPDLNEPNAYVITADNNGPFCAHDATRGWMQWDEAAQQFQPSTITAECDDNLPPPHDHDALVGLICNRSNYSSAVQLAVSAMSQCSAVVDALNGIIGPTYTPALNSNRSTDEP